MKGSNTQRRGNTSTATVQTSRKVMTDVVNRYARSALELWAGETESRTAADPNPGDRTCGVSATLRP
jgi:hypothetical protein